MSNQAGVWMNRMVNLATRDNGSRCILTCRRRPAHIGPRAACNPMPLTALAGEEYGSINYS
ncbi:hypothetical protein C1J03_05835 [Sulfitobacter sp. SK012]|nr:hypothetical protein C1J03_05835 [Sulfitobacter sp. SK012]